MNRRHDACNYTKEDSIFSNKISSSLSSDSSARVLIIIGIPIVALFYGSEYINPRVSPPPFLLRDIQISSDYPRNIRTVTLFERSSMLRLPKPPFHGSNATIGAQKRFTWKFPSGLVAGVLAGLTFNQRRHLTQCHFPGFLRDFHSRPS